MDPYQYFDRNSLILFTLGSSVSFWPALEIAPRDLDANNEYLLVIFNARQLLCLAAEHFPSPEKSFTAEEGSFLTPSISGFSENSTELIHPYALETPFISDICIQIPKQVKVLEAALYPMIPLSLIFF